MEDTILKTPDGNVRRHMRMLTLALELQRNVSEFAKQIGSADEADIFAFARDAANHRLPLLFIATVLQGAEITLLHRRLAGQTVSEDLFPSVLVPVVYIAGPYSGPDALAVEHHVRAAEEAAYELYRRGMAPVCPHTTTRYHDASVSYDFMCRATMATMLRCDAVLVLPNWRKSKGAVAEVEAAREVGLPVFDTYDALCAWAKNFRCRDLPQPFTHQQKVPKQ